LSNRVISGPQLARLLATSATPMAFGAKQPVSLGGENIPAPLVRDSPDRVTLAGAGKQMFKVIPLPELI